MIWLTEKTFLINPLKVTSKHIKTFKNLLFGRGNDKKTGCLLDYYY